MASYILIALVNISFSIQSAHLTTTVREYYKAKNDENGDASNFMADTVKIWFETKAHKPTLRIKGRKKSGPWANWDREFKSHSDYDSLWLDQDNSVSGIFYENNEFYEMIGKPATRTTRTFWFDDNGLISGILIVWQQGQKTSDHYLAPVVEWASKNAPDDLSQLYPESKIDPSNPGKWRILLERYRRETITDK